MGAVRPPETFVLLDIVYEDGGFVDYGKLGDARPEIHPVSLLDELAETIGGIDDEGLPAFAPPES